MLGVAWFRGKPWSGCGGSGRRPCPPRGAAVAWWDSGAPARGLGRGEWAGNSFPKVRDVSSRVLTGSAPTPQDSSPPSSSPHTTCPPSSEDPYSRSISSLTCLHQPTRHHRFAVCNFPPSNVSSRCRLARAEEGISVSLLREHSVAVGRNKTRTKLMLKALCSSNTIAHPHQTQCQPNHCSQTHEQYPNSTN